MYREARFAVKVRRGGWETMRIYEILAAGSVPYIEKVEDIPESALIFVNKSLLRPRSLLRNRLSHGLGWFWYDLKWFCSQLRRARDLVDAGLEHLDLEQYSMLAAELLRHTQQHLTTQAAHLMSHLSRSIRTHLGSFDPFRIF